MTEFKRITSQGRIVIPQGYLDELGVEIGDHVRLDLNTEGVVKMLVIRKVD